MNVLVAIADDCCTNHIFEFIVRQNWAERTHVKLLTVSDGHERRSHARKDRNEKTKTIKGLQTKFAQDLAVKLPKVHIEQLAVNGAAPKEIVELARTWPADLIVIGAHGRKGIDRILLGSVSAAVLEMAPCSVAVVKLPTAPVLDMILSENDLPQQISSFELSL
jgi:nucleotide-binding universal stress UspA family protein